jgi:hypothetical protein
MKLINETLHDKQLKVADLSDAIRDDIYEYKELLEKYNEAVKVYNDEPKANKATEAKLDAMENDLAELESGIIKEIKAYDKPAPAPAPTPAPTPAPAPAPANADGKKEGGSGIGWLLFAGAVLVVTLGAVKLKNK